MEKHKGGRGHTAPYVTTHVRIPEELKSRVEKLKDLYFSDQLQEYERTIAENERLAAEYKKFLTSKDLTITLSDAIILVKTLIKQRKAMREVIAKLLTAFYNVEVTKETLM